MTDDRLQVDKRSGHITVYDEDSHVLVYVVDTGSCCHLLWPGQVNRMMTPDNALWLSKALARWSALKTLQKGARNA
jgi:hypothetical protein